MPLYCAHSTTVRKIYVFAEDTANDTTATAIRIFDMPSGLLLPQSTVIDGNDLYIGNQNLEEVVVVAADTANDTEATVIRRFDLPSGLTAPFGMAIHGNDLYILDSSGDEVFVVAADTANDTTATAIRRFNMPSGLTNPLGMAIHGNDLYIADSSGDEVFVVAADTANDTTATAIRRFNMPSVLTTPTGMAIHGNDLYIADNDGDEVFVVAADTANDTTATAIRRFNMPSGLTNPTGMTFKSLQATLTLSTTDTDIREGEAVDIDIDSDADVSGFTASDITVTGGTRGALTTNSATSYTLRVTAGSAGMMTVSIAEDVVTEGNIAASEDFTINARATATITFDDASGESGGDTGVNINFGESVSGLQLADLSASSGTLSNLTGSGTSWEADLAFPATGMGTVTVTLAEDSVIPQNAEALASIAYTQADAVFAITPEIETIKAGNTADIDITSDIGVSGLTDADISVDVGTLGTLVTNDTDDYTIPLTAPDSGSGEITITIRSNAVTQGNAETTGTVDYAEVQDRIFAFNSDDDTFDAFEFDGTPVTAENQTVTFTNIQCATRADEKIYAFDTVGNMVRIWDVLWNRLDDFEPANPTDNYRAMMASDTHLILLNDTSDVLEYYDLTDNSYVSSMDVSLGSGAWTAGTRGGDNLFLWNNTADDFEIRTLVGALSSTVSVSNIPFHTMFATDDRLHLMSRSTGGTTAYDFTGTAQSGDNLALGSGAWFASLTTFAPAPDFGTETIANQSWTVGTAVSLELPEATGGTGAITYSLSPTTPAGVSFTAGTRTLAGNPTGRFSSATFTYTATDANSKTVELTFTIVVIATAISFASIVGSQAWVVGTAVSLTLPTASGGVGAFTYSLSPALPAGVSFDDTTRVVSGNPTATATVATYTYTATDSESVTDTLTFTVVVTASSITFASTIPNYAWIVGTAVSVTLPTASGGVGTITYSLSPTTPAGVAFTASTRVLSGNPTGRFTSATYTYTATDADGTEVDSTFTIVVTAPAFSFASNIANQAWVVGTAVSVTLPSATGGVGTLAYSLTPTIPAGVTFTTGTRVLAGNPTARFSSAAFIYTVTDAEGETHTQSFTIVVTAVAITFASTIDDQSWVVGTTVSETLPTASGGVGAFTYSLSPALPAGVSFDDMSRELSGDPTAIATVLKYTYTATDSEGITATSDFNIVVAASAITFAATIDDQAWVVGDTVNLNLPTASGGVGLFTYSLTPTLPTGISFTAGLQLLAGTPTGRFSVETFTYTATDEDDSTAELTFTIVVTADAITFASTFANQAWVVGTTVNEVLPTASGGVGSFTYSLSPTTPAGVTFTTGTRVLAGDPTARFSLATFTYTAEDAEGITDTQTFTIVVTATAITFASIFDDQEWVVGTAVSLTLPTASGGVGAFTYALTPAVPSGTTFTTGTRVLAGTPTAVLTTATFTYTATDSEGIADTQTFTIVVTAALGFGTSTIANQAWIVGTAVSVTLPQATGGTGTIAYTLSPTTPAGATFTALTRILAGTPTGRFTSETYTYTATDGNSDTVELTFTIVVTATAITFATAIGNQSWVIGTAVSLTLPTASGGVGAFTYSLSPAVPAGITFTAGTRDVSGTPTTAVAVATYTYTATDIEGITDTLSFTIVVTAAIVPLALGLTVPTENVGNTFSFTLTSNHEIEGVALGDVRIRRLSPAANYNPATHSSITASVSAVAGTNNWQFDITFASSFNFDDAFIIRLRANQLSYDGGTVPSANIDSAQFHIDSTVGALSFGSETIDNQAWVVGAAVSLELPEATGGTGTITYSISPTIPAGLTFTAGTRDLSGNPTARFSLATFTYTATDGSSDTVELTFTIVVTAVAITFASTIAAQTWVVGTAVSEILPTASGGVGTLAYSLSSTLPSGVTFTASTRALAGNPTGRFSSASFTYTVTDAEGETETQSFTIVVTAAAITFASTFDDQEWIVGTAVNVRLPRANGGVGAFTYTVTPAVPAGMTFTASTRRLTGTPTTAVTVATYTYTATDSESVAETQSFTIVVTAALTFGSETIAAQAWVVGTAVSETLPEATGGTGAIAYTLSPTTPAGVAFTASSRELAGNPTGRFTSVTFTYTATDADSDTVELTFTIVVTAPAIVFSPTSFANQSWTVDMAVALTLPSGSGGVGDLTASLTGTLPVGTTFTPSSRALAGTPTAVFTSVTFTYTMTDDEGEDASITFTIVVAAAALVLSFGTETIGHQSWDVGTAVSITLPEGINATGTKTYSLSGTLPTGVTFTASTRVLAGTPTGRFMSTTFTYTVTDTDSNTAELAFTIVVEAETIAFAASIGNQSWTADELITSFTLPTATGGVGALTYSLSPTLPTGITFVAGTRIISGTPAAAATVRTYTYRATDSETIAQVTFFTIVVARSLADEEIAAQEAARVEAHRESRLRTILPVTSSGLEVDLVATFQEVLNEYVLERFGSDNVLDIPVRHLWNPETCSADLLLFLATAMSVDVDISVFSVDQQRALIRDSFEVHRRKGTVGSIKRIIDTLGWTLATDGFVEGQRDTTDPTEIIRENGGWAQFTIEILDTIPVVQARAAAGFVQQIAPVSRKLYSFDFSSVPKFYDGGVDAEGEYTFLSDGTFTHGSVVTDETVRS